MTHYQATRILNRVREGADYPLSVINQALMICGDLDE